MGELYKLGDIDNEQFYILPKGLFTNPKYKELSITARVVYSLLKDRMELSRQNNWHDDDGSIFLFFKVEKIAELLCTTRKTATRAIHELQNVELIKVIRQGLAKPNKIYIYKVESGSFRGYIKMGKNYTSRSVKSTHQDVQNLPTNDTDFNKTKQSKTEKSQYECSPELAEALEAFAEHRKKLGKKMTDYAKKLLLKKLEKMAKTEEEKIAILNQSILNGWQGIFELKNDKQRNSHPSQRQSVAEQSDNIIRMMEERGLLNDEGGEKTDSSDADSLPSWLSE